MTTNTPTFADSWRMELVMMRGSSTTPEVRVVCSLATRVDTFTRKGRELTPWLEPSRQMACTCTALLLRPRGMFRLWEERVEEEVEEEEAVEEEVEVSPIVLV